MTDTLQAAPTASAAAPSSIRETPVARVLAMARAHLTARAVHVFATLGIADVLGDGRATAASIAAMVGCHADPLARILTLLAAVGVVVRADDGTFALTDVGRTLRTDYPYPTRDAIRLIGSPFYWSAIGALSDTVMTGRNAFRHAHGDGLFEYLARHPADGHVFDTAMSGSVEMSADAVLTAYDFSRFHCVVDVGGGSGAFLQRILTTHAHVDGIVYDRPQVIDQVQAPKELRGRMRLTAGSFFEAVPEGADAYLLRRVLHDWDDERAIRILRRCRQAIRPDGRLVIVELAPPARDDETEWPMADLLMLVLLDGRERTAEGFEKILRPAGFVLANVIATMSPFWILEALPN